MNDVLTAKQYLKQAHRLNELINSEVEELEQLMQLSSSTSSSNLSGMPSSSNRNTEATYAKAVIKVIDLEEKIKDEIASYVKLKDEIRDTINALTDNDEKLLLRYRYINFLTWEEICEKLNISMRTVHRFHASALQNIKVPQ